MDNDARRKDQLSAAYSAINLAQESGRSLLLQVDGGIGIGKSVFLLDLLGRVRSEARQGAPARVLRVSGSARSDSPLGAIEPLIAALLGPEAVLVNEVSSFALSSVAVRCAEQLVGSAQLLAIDDVDRLDPVAVQFLVALMTAPPSPQLIVVATHRPGHEPVDLVRAAREAGFQHDHLTLAPLADPVIAAMISDLAPTLHEGVIGIAQGNPMFARVIREALRRHPEATDAAEALRLAEAARSPVLGAAIVSDIESLPSDPRHLLEVLAALGDDADTATVVAIAGLERDSVREGIAELRSRTLLSEDSRVPLHPVIRHCVGLHSNTATRADLRRRVVSLPGVDPASRAEHLAQLGHRLTPTEAEELIELIGDLLCGDPAVASRLIRSVPAGLRGRTGNLIFARVLLMGGDTMRARDVLLDVLQVCEREGAGLAEPQVLLAAVYQTLGRHDEARMLLETLSSCDEALADVSVLRVIADTWALIDGAVPLTVLQQLEAHPSADDRFVAQIYRAMGHLHAGEIVDAQRELDDMSGILTFAADSHLQGVLSVPLGFAAWVAYRLERFELCARIAARGLRIVRDQGRVDGSSLLGVCLTLALAQLGRLDEAELSGTQAKLDAERYGPQGSTALAAIALMLVAEGRFQQEPGLLRTRYNELLSCELPVLGWWRGAVLTARTRVSAMLGAPEYSPELLRQSDDAASPQRFAEAAFAAAQVGDRELAQALITQANMNAAFIGLSGQQAVVWVLEAQLLLAWGQPVEARALLTEARTVFVESGMLLHQARASAILADIDRALSQQSSHLESLTERELEVAKLVAAGLKNREIAKRLVISTRTAENHVARLLRKLELGSRQDLAVKFGNMNG